MTQHNRLRGQTVLVTGGASGLGRAIVAKCIDAGANVGVLDRSAEGCAQLQEAYLERIVTVPGDVRSLADNQRVVRACEERFGALDCAIGNAGIWDYSTALVDLPDDKLSDAFDEVFRVNVLGYVMLAKAATPALVRSEGSMVFTVSNAGYLADGGGVLYTASKHAVVGLVKQLAFELAPRVRVNGVAPGPIATRLSGPESLGMGARRFPGERLQDEAASFVPLGKMPTPDEYASAYLFFASREDHVPATGSVLNYDGGFAVRGFGDRLRGGDDLADRFADR